MIDYAIYMLDPNGIVTNWNAGAQRIKGYAPDEIIGQHFGMFYTPEERAAGPARPRARDRARAKDKYEAEGWRVRKDGTRFFASVVIDPLYEEGDLVGFAKITRDITERKTARNALLDSERNFRLLVSGVTDYALYMLDPGRHRRRAGTPAAQRIKGYTPTEIIGQHFSRFYTEQDRPPAARAGAVDRTRDRPLRRGRLARSQGWLVFLGQRVIDPIRDENGKLIGFAKITRDITERREAQMELARGPAAACRIAEDGCARPAHRRRGARLQQPSDGRGGQHPDAEDDRRQDPKAARAVAGDRVRHSARRRLDRGNC